MNPTQRYTAEFRSACEWSAARALCEAMRPWRAEDCVDWAIAGPVLEQFLAPYSDGEIAARAAAINFSLLPQLNQACGYDFALTLGWIETPHHRIFEHDWQLPQRLLEQGARRGAVRGLPMHVWLTSPAHEIIDVALPLRIAQPSDDELARQVFYFSHADTEPIVTYHPTVVGSDFLVRIGAPLSLEAGDAPIAKRVS